MARVTCGSQLQGWGCVKTGTFASLVPFCRLAWVCLCVTAQAPFLLQQRGVGVGREGGALPAALASGSPHADSIWAVQSRARARHGEPCYQTHRCRMPVSSALERGHDHLVSAAMALYKRLGGLSTMNAVLPHSLPNVQSFLLCLIRKHRTKSGPADISC